MQGDFERKCFLFFKDHLELRKGTFKPETVFRTYKIFKSSKKKKEMERYFSWIFIDKDPSLNNLIGVG